MSLPEGKAIYLIAFSSPCLVYANSQTYLSFICLLFIYVNNICVYLLYSNFILYLCSVFKKQCLIKILNVMEKYYLCSIQSKVNSGANETVLVSVEDISDFVSSNLRPDCILLISQCSTFKAISHEK